MQNGRKRCHFSLKVFVGPKGTIEESVLFVTVLFIREEWLSLFTLLNTGFSGQFRSEMLLKLGENTF